jgi:diphthine synthase
MGLHDEKGITLHGLEEVKTADTAFIELYTSYMPSFSLENLQQISETKLETVTRKELEEKNGEVILKAAEKGKAVLLVPGDPLIATTHVALRIQAEKAGMRTRIVHGCSILSAVIGLSGLQHYKFGKSVTIPFPDQTFSETPYDVITQNQKLGVHTLCLLDIVAEQKRYLTIPDGLKLLLKVEEKKRKKTIMENTLAVGIARAGSDSPTVRADHISRLLKYDFGEPPHSIIFPGRLHFMEAEALIVLAGAPEKLRNETQ